MTFAAPPPASMSPMLAPLTPEEERQLAAMQQQLAAPQPTPTPTPGPALAAMAPTPAPTPEPIGPALAATEPRRSNASLAAYISAGGNDFRSIYPNLAPEEQAFIDGMRSGLGSSGQMTTERELMLKALDTHLKSYRSSNIQTFTTSDGRAVDMLNGQVIQQPASEPIKYDRYQQEDGTMVMTDPTTGRTFPAWDAQTGAPIRGLAKFSPTQEEDIKRLQLNSEDKAARLTNLTRFTESDFVTYNNETGTYEPAGMFGGTKVKSLRKQLETEKSDYDKRLEVALRPVSRAASPSPTPSPTPDQFQVGKRYRDANGNVKTYRGNGNWE
jgi:hypothetical protein